MSAWPVADKLGGSSKLTQLVSSAAQQSNPKIRHEDRTSHANWRESSVSGYLVESGGGLVYSDGEESGDEDEEELLRNATPYYLEEESCASEGSMCVLFEAQALSNFIAIEEGDLGFKDREILAILDSSRDDGWLLAQNALGERGHIPSNYVQKLPSSEEPGRTATPADGTSITPRRGRDLWAKLKKTVTQTSLADVLSALGAIPSGFRDSTLAKLLADSRKYLTSTWALPKPSPTGMGFRDLRWDFVKDQLEAKQVRMTREFSVLATKMIPLPGKGVKVSSRHIRVSIFNKNDILSNIHTVRAVWQPNEEKTWKFPPKTQTSTNSLYHQVGVVRMDSDDKNIEILFELGITFKREKTGETGEISCGWSSLPLYELTGTPTPNKTYELKVHGGSPFESGVELDPATSIKSTGGLIPSILRTNQTPRLYVRLLSIPRAKKALYDLLPPNIVTSSLYAQPLACFRHLVGVAFLRGRLGLPLETYVVKPSLNVFLKALDQPDLMDAILTLYNERMKLAKRAERNSPKFSSEQLENVLLQWSYPMISLHTFPEQIWASEDKEKERVRLIDKFSKKTQLAALLSADSVQTITDLSEQIFSIYPRT